MEFGSVSSLQKVSIIILFRNEKGYARDAVMAVYNYFSKTDMDYEIIAVDDSADETWDILKGLEKEIKELKVVRGDTPPGYGKAVRKGLRVATGDILINFSGDLSDSLDDVKKYVDAISSGYDMVFGSRFMNGSNVSNYPVTKMILN